MVPLAFLAGVLRSRLARAAAGDLLLALGRGTPLRDALADALRDPTLEIAYWLPERNRFVSADGKEIHDGRTRTAHYVERDGKRIAALLHDPSLAYDPELVEAVAAAAGLWLDNERLQADLRAQVAFLDTVVNTSPSLLCALDLDGRIVNFNIACGNASGRTTRRRSVTSSSGTSSSAPAEREEMRARFEAAAPAPPADRVRAHVRRRAGRGALDRVVDRADLRRRRERAQRHLRRPRRHRAQAAGGRARARARLPAQRRRLDPEPARRRRPRGDVVTGNSVNKSLRAHDRLERA